MARVGFHHVQELSTRSRLLTATGSFSVIPIFDATQVLELITNAAAAV